MSKLARHSDMTEPMSSSSVAVAMSSLIILKISFVPTTGYVRNFPQCKMSLFICFGGSPRLRERNGLLPRRLCRKSSHDSSAEWRCSFSSLEIGRACPRLRGSKCVEAEELAVEDDITEDGREGGCGMGWMKSFSNVKRRGSAGPDAENGSMRRGWQLLQQLVRAICLPRSSLVQLSSLAELVEREPIDTGIP